jgi:arsenate reductase (glutaredoxin)
MVPQLIGNRKSQAFRGCERYFRERGIEYQTRDPMERPLGRREIEAIAAGAGGVEQLLDTEGAAYRDRGLAWMDYDPLDELSDHPELLRLPIVRSDAGVAVRPDVTGLDDLFRA